MNKFLPTIGGHSLRLDEFTLMQSAYLDGFKALVYKIAPTGNVILSGLTVDQTGVNVVYTSGYIAIAGEIYSVAAGSFPKSSNPSDVLYFLPVEAVISPSSPVLYEDTTSHNVHFARVAIFKYKDTGDSTGVNYTSMAYPGLVTEGQIIPWYPPAGKTVSDYFDNTGKGINACEGYAICNGLNNTLDLRGMTLGMTTNTPYTGGSNPLRAILDGLTYGAGTEGGHNVITLTKQQLPNYALSLSVSDPGHRHTAKSGYTFYSDSDGAGSSLSNSGHDAVDFDTKTADGLNNSTTGITVSGNLGGGGQSHENRQPTFYLYYITRIR